MSKNTPHSLNLYPDVMSDPELYDLYEKLFICYVRFWAVKNRALAYEACGSNHFLAHLLGISELRVRQMLNNLVARQRLKIEHDTQGSSLFTEIRPVPQNINSTDYFSLSQTDIFKV